MTNEPLGAKRHVQAVVDLEVAADEQAARAAA